jgi:CheY-like chemotaxis protein
VNQVLSDQQNLLIYLLVTSSRTLHVKRMQWCHIGLEGYSYNKTRSDVHTYNNPTKALSEFESNFYDLLLTDINMPYMNGFELLRRY